MKKATLFLICLGAFSLNGAAQKLKFSDIYIYGGAGGSSTGALNSSEISNLESGLNVPFVKQQYGYGTQNSRFTSQVGMMAAWEIRNHPNRKHKIRIGFSAGQYDLNYYNSRGESYSYRIDTLISATTGRTSYVDSFYTKNLYVYQDAQMFNINIDYLRTVNPRNKLSVYGGAGINVGLSMNNTIGANYSEYSYVNEPYGSNRFGPNPNGNQNNFRNESYTKELSMATSFRPYSLVGFNYKLSKRSPFLKHINIFTEFKMGLEINAMEELNTSAGFYYGFQGGLKVSL